MRLAISLAVYQREPAPLALKSDVIVFDTPSRMSIGLAISMIWHSRCAHRHPSKQTGQRAQPVNDRCYVVSLLIGTLAHSSTPDVLVGRSRSADCGARCVR
jgi:hypothetical protein